MRIVHGIQKARRRLAVERRPWRFLATRLLWRFRILDVVRLPPTKLASGVLIRPRCAGISVGLLLDNQRYENEVLRKLKSVLTAGDVFVDVGANVGLYSLEAARIVGDRGCVVAIEPHPRVFRYLEENIKLNGESSVVECWNVAASDLKGSAFLTDERSDDQNQLVGSAERAVPVPTVCLDDLDVVPERRIRLLKIDVEGHESAVLRGAQRLLSRTDLLLIEEWKGSEINIGDATVEVLCEGTHTRDLLVHLADGREEMPSHRPGTQ